MESSSLGPSKRARLPTQIPSCLVDGCTADLTKCRDYHRRHKVCELHSKTARVFIKGHEQRFCQQCSRFHSLGEFDEGKRSCRKRLDGHNRRRRKPQPESLSMNSSRLFSNRHGTRYLHFGSSQVFSTTVAAASPWHPSSIKSENDSILDYSNSNSSSRQSTLNFIASNSNNNNKSSSTLLPSPSSSTLSHQSCYTKGGPAGKQFPFLQQVPTGEEEEEDDDDEEATAADDSSGGLQSSKLFVLDSNRALSLLSSPMVHHDLNPPNQQQSQSSVHSLSSCCYTGHGVESESIGSVLVAADGSNGNGGLFQIGPDDHDGGGGSNGNGSGSHHHHHHQTLSFSWQ